MSTKSVQVTTKMVEMPQITTKMVLCEQDYVWHIYIHTIYGIIFSGNNKSGEKAIVNDKSGDFDQLLVDKPVWSKSISCKEQ